MSRDVAIGTSLFGSVWAVLEFGLIHSPELLGIVGPLLRLSRRTAWLPTNPLKKAWMAVTVLVFLVGLWKFSKSVRERLNQ